VYEVRRAARAVRLSQVNFGRPVWRPRRGGRVYEVRRAARTVRYRSRRLLVTTVTLESAMAAEATMGESRPNAAMGIPSVL